MKTLSETSIEDAFADASSVRRALAEAEHFTACFRRLSHLPTATREAEMLAVQFPGILLPPEADDRFVGRIRYGLVGLSPEPCGLGYYCAAADIRRWLETGEGDADDRERARDVVEFWDGRTTAQKVRAAYSPALAATLPSDAWTEESGVAFPLYRMAGSILDYGKLLTLGLDGLEAAAEPRGDDEAANEFRRALQSAIATLRNSIDHYAAIAPEDEMKRMLRSIRHRAPESFREAIQLFWIYAISSGTWNYGRLDVVLGPFLARDLDSGRLTEADALEMLCSLWRLMHAYNNQYDNRIVVGGRGRPDEAAADLFAILAIDATRRLRLNQPQLSLRFYDGQDPRLWELALDAISEGCTFPMLYNDDINIPAVGQAFTVSESLAAEYTPYGCGEYVLGHYSEGTPNGVINLLKALEVTLHGGCDPITGVRVLDVPEASAFMEFEDLWNAYAWVVEYYVSALAEQQRISYRVTDDEAPLLLISFLTSDCLARGRGAFGGGARYLGGTIETYGNTNTANSLHAIQELVYREKILSLDEFVAVLDGNFAGHDALRARCLAVTKYGNDEAFSDAMACRVHQHVCRAARDQSVRVGLDSYLVVIINNWANTVLGRKTSASAEGRLAGEPMANGNNPTPGSDLSGATAFLNSLARLDSSIHAGAVQNMKFSKDWFGSMRPKFDALLRTYFHRGGTQAMVTVVSRDDLEAAMREPEKWGHLMVRVGGFSIRFVELPRDGQCEVLARTLH